MLLSFSFHEIINFGSKKWLELINQKKMQKCAGFRGNWAGLNEQNEPNWVSESLSE